MIGDRKMNSNEFDEIKNDTIETRRLFLKSACRSFFEKILAHNFDNPKKQITNLIFFVNPLMDSKTSYSQAMYKYQSI